MEAVTSEEELPVQAESDQGEPDEPDQGEPEQEEPDEPDEHLTKQQMKTAKDILAASNADYQNVRKEKVRRSAILFVHLVILLLQLFDFEPNIVQAFLGNLALRSLMEQCPTLFRYIHRRSQTVAKTTPSRGEVLALVFAQYNTYEGCLDTSYWRNFNWGLFLEMHKTFYSKSTAMSPLVVEAMGRIYKTVREDLIDDVWIKSFHGSILNLGSTARRLAGQYNTRFFHKLLVRHQSHLKISIDHQFCCECAGLAMFTFSCEVHTQFKWEHTYFLLCVLSGYIFRSSLLANGDFIRRLLSAENICNCKQLQVRLLLRRGAHGNPVTLAVPLSSVMSDLGKPLYVVPAKTNSAGLIELIRQEHKREKILDKCTGRGCETAHMVLNLRKMVETGELPQQCYAFIGMWMLVEYKKGFLIWMRNLARSDCLNNLPIGSYSKMPDNELLAKSDTAVIGREQRNSRGSLDPTPTYPFTMTYNDPDEDEEPFGKYSTVLSKEEVVRAIEDTELYLGQNTIEFVSNQAKRHKVEVSTGVKTVVPPSKCFRDLIALQMHNVAAQAPAASGAAASGAAASGAAASAAGVP